MTKNTWSQEHNNILLEYCSKKISLQEIAIALDKKIRDIKYHIGDLAVADFKNGISKDDLCTKYNLTMSQLNGCIHRVTKAENKLKEKSTSSSSSTITTRSKYKENKNTFKNTNGINNSVNNSVNNGVTNEDVFIVIELLKEIRDILKSQT